MQLIRTLLLIVILSLPFLCTAQTTTDSTLIRNRKWEIGIDLLGFFNIVDADANGFSQGPNVPKGSILFKRNYGFSNGKSKAWRFRIGNEFQKNNGKSFDLTPTGDYSTYVPYLSIGHEWKKVFSKYSWFSGTDIFGTVYHSNRVLFQGFDDYEDYRVRNYNFGISGLIGFQVNLTKYLSLSTESAILIKYEQLRVDTKNISGGSLGGDFSHRLGTVVKPVMVVNFIYSLQKKSKNVKK
jgi:hypothetical protein